MSQEYKEVTLLVSIGRRLFETLLVVVVIFAMWLIAVLLSFHPYDPSWSQTAWHEAIHNLGGVTGAWFADTLFFVFGVTAYTIPVIIVGSCWFTWRQQVNDNHINYFVVSLRLIGALALILASCGLAASNADDIWYFASGGIIGSLLITTFQQLLCSGWTSALLCIWAAGLTLFTGWSWVSIAEKIGSIVLNILNCVSNIICRNNDTWMDKETQIDSDSRKSYRVRFLCNALTNRKQVEFNNSINLQIDTKLFPGKQMHDDAVVDFDDVLFSSYRATQSDHEGYDLLLNRLPIKENVQFIAASATQAHEEQQTEIAQSANTNRVVPPFLQATLEALAEQELPAASIIIDEDSSARRRHARLLLSPK